MSDGMLAKIIKDMYIDPELLAELDDDQKQILFRCMREEQIRRWELKDKEHDDYLANQAKEAKQSTKDKKVVNFLKGDDGNDWVWVMGEHKNDLTIEEILERETLTKAEIEAREEAERLLKIEEEENERRLKREEEEARRKTDLEAMKKLNTIRERTRKKSIELYEQRTKRRSRELMSQMSERRKSFREEALKEDEVIEREWKEREEKVKVAEKERRESFIRARREHQENKISFKNEAIILKNFIRLSNAFSKTPDNLKNTKPRNKDDVLAWFRKCEKPNGTGYDPSTNKIATWFHGIIGREKAEDLLKNEPPCSFLIRVSEKIWGYVLSYKTNSKTKHCIIDTTNGTYQFLSGNSKYCFKTLAELIEKYKKVALSPNTGETLKFAVGQKTEVPDYEELTIDDGSESSHL
ncbi:DgyrCDS13782 [Dimorphilus gyrociliatus]|uniref:DgyrCDS13782 n=1 Tax=Dimorphilus gyrociliatus TaxID=2664684 RepID=A0A7I8WBX8_9ANNE|nr:DgyrCDS13782 [Dimorphilus gyrociliatus]